MATFKTPKKTGSAISSSVSSTPLVSESVDPAESRKRQSKRDEAIRRRLENDFSKKRLTKTSSSKKRSKHGSAPGSVLSLRPSDAVVCKPTYTAAEAAQLMSAKRENCILVVDDEEQLLGIFTAKDLAFRVVGKGVNASGVTIEQIMTPNPMCAKADTPASEALNLMVQRGFRHLPVIDDNNSIVGVLDITKCYQEAMEKLERMYESSKKLHDALEGVHMEIGVSQQPLHVMKYFESLKSVMSGPTLESVLDSNTLPCYVNVKTSVFDAAVLMKENHTTAVLVKDANEVVTGIFTSKDVVLRVIAAGLNPKNVSVIRVMTAQPDVAPKELSIQAALRKMFDGHYLNLPVVDHNEIIGIVEVLKLTYATLEQISMMKSADDEESSNAEGPAWNKFWTSLDNDTESVHSNSQLDSGSNLVPDISQSEINQFSLVHDNLAPGDSISVTNETQSASNALQQQDFKEIPFTFKFTSPSGRVHRISVKPIDGTEVFRDAIIAKLKKPELQELNHESFAISYIDDEGDIVAITSDQDLIDCVLINKGLRLDKADIFIHHPDDHIDLDEYHQKKQLKSGKPVVNGNNDGTAGQIVPGLTNELLIGGIAVFAGTAVALAFILGKKS
ncbi:CBS-domain-containing protein [Cyberlindnera jadinii NRRL Y-1542]|uniref:CBS-domain-containing protein n=1 Tax=Cyberlindnera jadinii (strain ATCC 18201 / CBS 1600 / BCRC 20928 / JCM 3617 / NBRC 0987 / NRRL Y-1542) TaxID=983966 RepID=A0A1E4S450_CYBJN|nr:CBS-domain-containing protein [Cyberlindnera jadinii NRRL Y-1542]ODV74306.1 CBS-domain-containing protein [Cyberlindnera jadinii NRRL Y-1542]